MCDTHEMDGDSGKTDINGRTKPLDESNLIEDVDMPEDNVKIRGVDENGSSNDTTNVEMVFESKDENIVVCETIECKSNCNENNSETTLTTESKSLEKSSYGSTTTDEKMNQISSEEQEGNEQIVEQVEDEEIISKADEVTQSAPVNVKIVKVSSTSFYINIYIFIYYYYTNNNLFLYITQSFQNCRLFQ